MNSDLKNLILDVREQILYLQELGVGALDVTLPQMSAPKTVAKIEASSARGGSSSSLSNLIPVVKTEPARPAPVTRPADGRSRLASLPSLSQRPIAVPPRAVEMPAIDTTPKMESHLPVPAPATVSTLPEPIETIEQIRAEIGPDCTRCPLHALGRSKVVNSVGNFDADLMFVGEAPGADEDAKGEPFVGRAGQLLTDIIKAMGYEREDVFIGNINRCRPPGNRAPVPEESVVCKPFLFREIAVVRPKVIVVLGATAAQNLLETKVPIGKLRGHFHDYLGTKVMPTFHPAYLLRDPHKKREVWEDMKMVMAFLGPAK